MISTNELARLEALADCATPVPWERGYLSNRGASPDQRAEKGTYVSARSLFDTSDDATLVHDEGSSLTTADARYLVAAVNAVPALCAEVRRLRDELGEREPSRFETMTDDAIRAVLTAEVKRVEDLVSSRIGQPGHDNDDAWDGWNSGALNMMQWIAKGEVIR